MSSASLPAPTWDPGAETAVLAAVLADPTILADVRARVGADDYGSPGNADVHRAMCAIADRSDTLCAITLHDEIDRAGRLSGIGGPERIAELLTAAGDPVDWRVHAEIVARHARTRATRRTLSCAIARLDAPGGRDELADIRESVVSDLGAAAPAKSAEWEPPVPLDTHPNLPEFPVAALPEWGRGFVGRLADSTQTPEDLAGALALGVLAGSVAGKYEVEVKGGWWETLSLYLMAVMRSGERKSAVFGEVTRPVKEYERERSLALAPAVEEATQARELLAERAKAMRSAAARAKGAARKAAEEALSEAAHELAAVDVPKGPRFIADDVTPEALVALLADNGGRLLVASPEGGLFETLAGRYSDGVANLDAVLKAHAGDSIRVDRMGRPPLYIARPALSLALAVQPDVLRGLAGKPGFRGRGLIARILYSVPRSRVGSRRIDVQGMHPDLIARWGQGVRVLLTLPVPAEGERLPVLLFGEGARRLLLDFMRELEPRLGEGGDLAPMCDWASKLAGAVARIAGILALAETPGTVPEDVPEDAVRRALDFGRYYLAHAQAAYGMMGADSATERARYILAWFCRARPATVTRREVMRGCRGVRRVADLAPALDLLTAHGYIREAEPTVRRGAAPVRDAHYEVHPAIIDGTDADGEGEAAPAGRDARVECQGHTGRTGHTASPSAPSVTSVPRVPTPPTLHSVPSGDAADSPHPSGDPDYPTGWTVGARQPCEVCGLEATSRDPRGVTRHPWCSEARP